MIGNYKIYINKVTRLKLFPNSSGKRHFNLGLVIATFFALAVSANALALPTVLTSIVNNGPRISSCPTGYTLTSEVCTINASTNCVAGKTWASYTVPAHQEP